jgi:lysine 2,3-aminomutase
MIQPQPGKYTPTAREQAFLETVEETRYEREIINGLAPFFNEKAPEDMLTFYDEGSVTRLKVLKGTERDVESRMPVKLTRHYYEIARNSEAVARIVKASPEETDNLEGSEDPGNQMDYSPVEGLLHKYEMGLMYVVSTCSAHCRFCYREELIARKEIARQDGTVKKKGLAKIPEICAYIRAHNELVESNGGRHPETGREKLREILLSGGDPMVLNNSKIAAWLAALAESGVETIRIGTKEMAFYPQRFDRTFLEMLDRFHETYPQVGLNMMLHFEHPDEILQKNGNGQYIRDEMGFLQWIPATGEAMRGLVSRGWLTVQNQAPIIKGINDDPDALRILQREFKRAGGENHYFFCGRDIVAYKAFNIPIEKAWQTLTESQRGLSGTEKHARLSITHYKGKTEVAAVTDKPIPGLKGAENGVVIFKLLRNPADAPELHRVCIVGRNPEALWFDDYADRVLFDEAGLFDYERVDRDKVVPTSMPVMRTGCM